MKRSILPNVPNLLFISGPRLRSRLGFLLFVLLTMTLTLCYPGVGLAAVTDITPFELDAHNCSGADCDVLGTYDWGNFVGGVLVTGYVGNPLGPPNPFSGARNTVMVYTDGSPDTSSGCPVRPAFPGIDDAKLEADTYRGGEFRDATWPLPSASGAPNKSDFCYIYSAYEWVSVPDDSGGFQDHLLLYTGFDSAVWW